ncbi:MAG: MoaD/ThiS family protein [Streptosporangiales bacterium]|nr:MoaD/ThiS family protein [Streptosporangiales bacterium]MBO0889449.1 MoaD/ThiS family protein [Acidothermales bacterium]
MSHATIRYWAAARDAAGTAEESYQADDLGELLELVRGQHGGGRFADVLACCSFLVDGAPVGTRSPDSVVLPEGATVEALPPFAGG